MAQNAIAEIVRETRDAIWYRHVIRHVAFVTETVPLEMVGENGTQMEFS